MTYTIDNNYQAIIYQEFSNAPSGDAKMLVSPRADLTDVRLFIADSGFDSNENMAYTHMPLIKRGGKLSDPKRKSYDEDFKTLNSQKLYRKRWKIESVNSVIKRKFGETIYARKEANKMKELILKGFIYNIHRFQVLNRFTS